jgi:hypothetical protein
VTEPFLFSNARLMFIADIADVLYPLKQLAEFVHRGREVYNVREYDQTNRAGNDAGTLRGER